MAVITIYPARDSSLFSLVIAFSVLSTIIIVLRFWSRCTLRAHRFGLDDWFALAAWPFAFSAFIVVALLLRSGVGNHFKTVPYPNIRRCLILLWTVYHLYNTALVLVRISALLFYRRVFESTTKYFRINFWTAIAANLAWWFALEMVVVFICTPIHSYWDRRVEHSTCGHPFDSYIGSGVPSVFLDLWILLMPMPLLWKLHLPREKKIVLGVVFVLGYCVVVLTIGRLISVSLAGESLNTDFTWSFPPVAYWYAGEIGVAFICISLPSVFTLWNRARRHGFAALFHNGDCGQRWDSQSRLVGSRPTLEEDGRGISEEGSRKRSEADVENVPMKPRPAARYVQGKRAIAPKDGSRHVEH